jgi:hypothetical protein
LSTEVLFFVVHWKATHGSVEYTRIFPTSGTKHNPCNNNKYEGGSKHNHSCDNEESNLRLISLFYRIILIIINNIIIIHITT